MAGVVSLAALAGPSAAGGAVAAQDQWGFEQVTPSDKGGASVKSIDTFQARSDGGAFLLSATAPFEGVPAESAPLYTRYLATRTSDGWVNRAVDAPDDPVGNATITAVMTVVGTSHDLAYAVVASTRALAPGAIAGGGNVYIRNTATGAYRLVAASSSERLVQDLVVLQGALAVKYVAPEGDVVLFASRDALVDGSVPQENAVTLYKWTAGTGLEVVSRLPESEGGAYVPAGNSVGNNAEYLARRSVPRVNGGNDVYFSSAENSSVGPVYHWDNGEVSVVTKSQIPGDESPAVSADVEATTSGGEFALIQTSFTARLTTDAPSFEAGTPEEGGGRVLYRYERQSGQLRYVGVVNDPFTQAGAIQMSDDGRTVVFKTQYQLTPDAAPYLGFWDPNTKQNVYAWRDGTLKFIAAVDVGAKAERAEAWLRILSENGRFFAFSDNSPGTAGRFGISDNSSSKCAPGGTGTPVPCDQVYVFDIENATLECASCRPDGGNPRGNSGDPTVSAPGYMRMNAHQAQTVANDGTTFLTSSDDLVAADGNGQPDVYAFRDGALRLVSPGVQGASARFLDATADGGSIFFATNAQLAETDNDRSIDVYVTRRGGGYADRRPTSPPACSGGDCKDPNPESSAVPRTPASEAASGAPPAPVRAARAQARLAGVVRRKASLRVTVRNTSAGRLRISGAQIKTTVRNPRRAGDITVTVPLSSKARTTIQRGGRLRVRVRVSLTPPFGPSAASTSIRTVR